MTKLWLGAAVAVTGCVLRLAAADGEDVAMKQAKEVLAKMSLEQKISLCAGNGTMTLNAIPEVGIKKEFTMSDNSHTVRADMSPTTWDYVGTNDHSTVLPTLNALAATWDKEYAARHGHVLGNEMQDRSKDMLLGPGVNIMRTPLCGRNWEYMSEDPCLAAGMVVPLIKALQSHNVAACVKHFAVNNQEWERNSVDTEVDERTLREIYLPAFRAAVQEAKVLTVMNAYNKFRGEFCSANAYLQDQILRKEWGFKGFVVTDWGALHDTVKGALGGTDVEMNRGLDIRYFKKPLLDAVKEGKVPESKIDEMALHVLYVMAKIGFFDGRDRGKGSRNTVEHKLTAQEIAADSIVLLKNDRNVLPLKDAKVKTIVLMGKNVSAEHTRKGWSAEGKPLHETTPLEGVTKRLSPDVKIVYAPLTSDDENSAITPVIESAIGTFDTTAKDAGMSVRAWQVEYFANKNLEGSPVETGFDRTLRKDWKSNDPAKGAKAGNFSARWKTSLIAPETGTYALGTKVNKGAGTRIFVNGKLVADDWKGEKSNLSKGDVDMEKSKLYEVVVEYRAGEYESTCFFGWQLPSERGMTLAEAKDIAGKADAVVIFTGTEIGHGRALECEGGDRPNMLMPPGQDEAIARALKWNPNTVIVNHSGSPMEMPWIKDCHTLVQMWYLGQEAGQAITAILFGDVNPSGKLPHTMPYSLADTPTPKLNTPEYNAKKVTYTEGIFVGYRWYDKKNIEPMFPFGYGLSYTTFEYGKAKPSKTKLDKDSTITVKVDIKNTGKIDGKEVVQLYITDPAPKLPKAVRELKGFDKVAVKAGSSETAKMTIGPRDLSYYDVNAGKFRADKGKYVVAVGASSRDIKDTFEIELTEDWTE